MSDPYREATRNMGSSGSSRFGKVALVGGGLFLAVLIAMASAGVYFVKRVSSAIGDFNEAPAATLATMAERLGPEVTVVSSDEDEGKVVLRVGANDELVTVDVGESDRQNARPDGQDAEPAGQTVRFDGEADRSGGIVRVDTDEGRTTVELRGGEDRGFLDISTPNHQLRFGAGSGSSALPRWVPVYPGAGPGKRLFSVEIDEGSVGGAKLTVDAAPQEIFDWYREALEGHVKTVTSRSGRDGLERAAIETTAWGDEHRHLALQIDTDDDGRGTIVILYQTGHEPD